MRGVWRSLAAVAAVMVVLGVASPASARSSKPSATRVAANDPRLSYTTVSFVPDRRAASGWLAMVTTGNVITFFVDATNEVHVVYKGTGASIAVRQSEKYYDYSLTLAATNYRRESNIQWGLAAAPMKLEVTVTSGTLALDQIVLRSPTTLPMMLSPATANAYPRFVSFGDSIADGWVSGGPLMDSAGLADQLPGLIGPYLHSGRAIAGTTATCSGRYRIQSVIDEHPSLVVVAYGVNDLTGFYCGSTLQTFTDAMTLICSQLVSALPSAQIYLSAILPSAYIDENTRVTWNAAISGVATANGCTYADPSPVIDISTDLDGVHPTLQGHTKLAHFWARLLS